jgi:phage tail-like protein
MFARLSSKWVAPAFAVLLTLGLVFAANSFRTHPAAAHPINAAAPLPAPTQIALSTASWTLAFNQLSSITSTVDQVTDTSGGHTKQIGAAQPPTVVLARTLESAGNKTLNAWHQAARAGSPAARITATLTINEAGGKITYILENAWVSKLAISGVKAGSTQAAVETATIVCDEMIVH